FRDKPDHATALREFVGVADREDAPTLQEGENPLQSAGLGTADEKNMTVGDIFHATETPDDERAAVRFFVAHGLVERGVERLVTEHPDYKGRLRVRKRRHRPVDELRKVEQKNRL